MPATALSQSPTSRPFSISRRLAATILLFLLSSVTGQAVLAADLETAADVVRPNMDRTQYQQFCRALGVTRDQQMILDFSFSAYRQSIQSLLDRADTAAVEAGREQLEKFYAGRSRLERADVADLRVGVLRAYETVCAEADALFDQVIDDTLAVVVGDPAVQQPAVRALRRRVLLHPLHDMSTSTAYAGEGVDVLVLLEDARRPGAELESFDSATLHSTMTAYEQRLDAMLRDRSAAWRENDFASRIAAIQGDAIAQERLEKQKIEHWRQLYELNLWAVDTIAEDAGAVMGEDMAQAWRDRFDRACFAWLYRPREPDRQFEWIISEPLGEAVHSEASDIYTRYRAAHDPLSRGAMQIMLQARLQENVVLSAAMLDANRLTQGPQREMYQQLLRISGEQTAAETEAQQRLTDLLSAAERKQMTRALRRSRTR